MVHPTSFLFVTLDSCRYDTYVAARTPTLDAVGEVQRAMAPGAFTYASHVAMFMGFTPGDASRREAFVNPKWSKIFRMKGGGSGGEVTPFVELEGRSIIDGLKNIGYVAIGTGSMTWFNPKRSTTRNLVEDFERFFYPGDYFSLGRQIDFVTKEIAKAGDHPLFVFMNVGETHVPYWHEGADWSSAREDNPCQTFGDSNSAEESRRRQTACLEFVDQRLAPVLDLFKGANTLVCADHGDAWGEDGLWSHGFHHEKVLEVPLVLRLQNRPDQSRRARKRGLFGR